MMQAPADVFLLLFKPDRFVEMVYQTSTVQ
jgi:hypothetical protein